MAIEALGAREQEIAHQCIEAVSVLIEGWEMDARLGISCEELRTLILEWPRVDDTKQGSIAFLAINNSLNEICNGLRAEEWAPLVNATEEEVQRVYRQWLVLQNISAGIR